METRSPYFELDSSGRLVPLPLEAHIRTCVSNILLTQRGDSVPTPHLDLRSYLYRPVDSNLKSELSRSIHLVLEQSEPRITVQEVTIGSDPADPTKIRIELSYLIKKNNQKQRALVEAQ